MNPLYNRSGPAYAGPMNWLTLALISSIFLSLREWGVKQNQIPVTPAFMSWAMNLLVFLMLLALNLAMDNRHRVNSGYLAVLFTAALLDALAMVLYLGAIRSGNLSRTIPMLCFIPVVQLFVTPVLVKETLSAAGAAGVVAVVAGSYILNVDQKERLMSPVKAVFTDKAALMMLAVACIWGVSSSFHKIGVRQTNALFWGVTETGLITLFLTPLAWWSEPPESRLKKLAACLWPAGFSMVAVLTYYGAIGLGPVAYVSSVRRLGVLFSMVTGITLFREKMGPAAFAGGVVMIAGAAVITIWG